MKKNIHLMKSLIIRFPYYQLCYWSLPRFPWCLTCQRHNHDQQVNFFSLLCLSCWSREAKLSPQKFWQSHRHLATSTLNHAKLIDCSSLLLYTFISQQKIGQRNGLSPVDAEQANLLYRCGLRKGETFDNDMKYETGKNLIS